MSQKLDLKNIYSGKLGIKNSQSEKYGKIQKNKGKIQKNKGKVDKDK